MKLLSHTVNGIEKYITNYSGNVLSESSDINDAAEYTDSQITTAKNWLTAHGYDADSFHVGQKPPHS